MSWNPEFPFEPPGWDPILPRFPSPPETQPNIPPEGVPEDFTPASPYQPPTGPYEPPEMSPPPLTTVPLEPPIAPPFTPPSSPPPSSPPTTPPSSSPSSPSSPPPSSGAPTLPNEPPVRIWEDHREWSGERRTEPRSRIPIPRTPAPVFEGEWRPERPPPSPVWPIFGAVARVAGAVAGVLWPSELGNSELTPEQQQEARDAFERNNAEQLAAERTQLERTLREYERTHAAEWPGRYHRPQVEGTAGGILEGEYPLPPPAKLPEPELVRMTPPAPAIHPTPTPEELVRSRSSSSPSSSPTPSRARVPQPMQIPQWTPWAIVGALSGVLSSSTTGSRSRIAQELFSQPTPDLPLPQIPSATPAPFVDPLTPPRVPGTDPLTSPLTPFNTTPVGSSPPQVPTSSSTDQDRCRCGPKRKPRKKPRKCVARAGLRWVGGPKSGELAGSRCYAFKGSSK